MSGSSQHPEALLAAIFGAPTPLQAAYEEAVRRVRAASRILVVAHEKPDGDAMGSTLGMWHTLRALGKEAVAFNVHGVPQGLEFLPGASAVRSELAGEAPFDLTLVLDCAERHRVGAGFPAAGWGAEVVVIDHHQTWDPSFAQHYVRDVTAAAVGEMVFRFSLTAGLAPGLDAARCCYASILTDTGSFRYGSTTPVTFAIAGYLLSSGVSPWEIASSLFENDPFERVDLLRRALGTLTRSPCGRLAFICIDRQMMEETAQAPELLDGFINYARRIRGVEVAIQISDAGGGAFGLSFRSRGAVNVAALAARFGGGGHHNAAGCMMRGELPAIQAQLSAELSALLGEPV